MAELAEHPAQLDHGVGAVGQDVAVAVVRGDDHAGVLHEAIEAATRVEHCAERGIDARDDR